MPASDQDAALFGVSQGVGDEVAQDALDEDRIARHGGVRPAVGEAKRPVPRLENVVGADAREHGVDREGAIVHLDDPGIET